MAEENANLTACLLLHQHRRDTAIGLRNVTTKQRGLLWYYNTLLLRQRQGLLEAATAKGAMIEIRHRMAQLKRELKKAGTIEEKMAILIQAAQLEELAEKTING